MQTLPDTNGRTFFKWKSVGDTVDIVVTEAPVFDKPNQFGSKDSFLLGQNAEGETLQVPLPVNAKGKVQGEPFKEPEFYRAIMSIWFGNVPADHALKDAMLGVK